MKVFPSLISSDILNIRAVLKQFDDHCDGYHLDVMDDHFVSNLTWGPDFINRIRQATVKRLDIHLMVDNPHEWISRLDLNSRDMITFHIEAIPSAKEVEQLINTIHTNDLNAGIALNPGTAIDIVSNQLQIIDHILLMSVNPGFSGQSFIPGVIAKVQPLIEQRSLLQSEFLIGMDGGVGLDNISQLNHCGVDYVCVASAIFGQKNSVEALLSLKSKIKF